MVQKMTLLKLSNWLHQQGENQLPKKRENLRKSSHMMRLPRKYLVLVRTLASSMIDRDLPHLCNCVSDPYHVDQWVPILGHTIPKHVS
jgi:hypothetical protein